MNITIYGERCSGTNFLEESLKANFDVNITYKYGWKHFFGFYDFEKNDTDDTIFIGIIRNPIYWINSFSKDLYHIPDENKNLHNFLYNEFYSINEKNKNLLIKQDLNYITKDKYKNIFELRKFKNDFLMNIMPKKVKNYVLINYESLLYKYNCTLKFIKNKFNLKTKNDEIIKIEYYKKNKSKIFNSQKEITLNQSIIDSIWSNLDIEQENKLGYFKYDINEYFKKHGKAQLEIINKFN
jgi:hypothetical protein